jgi:YD repeat-containing protein
MLRAFPPGVLALIVFAAAADARQQKPPGPAPAKGPCRTYDTSVTSVTAGGPMRATIEWTGVFDPWSLRFVQTLNFSSNQGARFSYVQVSTWKSAEDFIAEVIRLKPPADLSTNPNGPVRDLVPPLTRSVSTTGNGAIALTKTNSYDTANRLTGFVTRSPGGTITTRYTAWDAAGRPTAGTMQSPTQNSTVKIAYDDKALTQTETITTRNLTSVMTYGYDQNGNMRNTNSTVPGGQPSVTTITPHSSATLCLGDMRKPETPPAAPAGPNPSGSFSATIGGQSWSAAIGMRASNTGSIVSVGGSDKRFIVSLGVSAKRGPGQYQAGSLENEDFSKLTPDQFSELIDRNSLVATVFDSQTKQSWQASPTLGKGTLRLTSVSGGAAGTFSLTLDAVPGSGASGSISFNGTFNIRY